MLELLAELLRGAVKESECVALFLLCFALLFVLHASNVRRLDDLRRRLAKHEESCPNGRD